MRAGETSAATSMKATNAVRPLFSTDPEAIRSKHSRMPTPSMMVTLSRKGKNCGGIVCDSPMACLRVPAKTRREQTARIREPEERVASPVRESAPALLDIGGCGPLAATEPAVAAGDNPTRMTLATAHMTCFKVLPGIKHMHVPLARRRQTSA